MATNAQNRATLFECDTCHRLFRDMEEFANHACDDPGSGGYDVQTLQLEDESLDLEGEDGRPIEIAPDSSVLWTRPATLLLISQYRENEELVTSGKLRKKALWNKIAKVLREKGNCNFSAVQVEGRWKTLMRGLKNVKDHNKKSGAERRNHPYEEELEFMAAKPNVQPECVVGTENKSSPETKSSKEESDSDECKICMEDGKIAETVFVPCGHLIACVKCASNLAGNKCPMCRKQISKAIKVFKC
ncbi:uncharacterized protein [Magallana gigas]|uniref:uncharacterized protein isoform X2 n=1 Tax=Magallana gigas TaxID=29159 RepID=UPI00148AB472|nr:uncharacterized protein LOC105327532 isoform X2 [Crassostrea gigas]